MPDNRKILKIPIAFLLCLVLIACTGNSFVLPSTPTIQIIATITSEEINPTNFISTPQRLVTATTSLRPSNTPTFSRPTRTWLEKIQATRTAETPEATNTPIPNFPAICEQPFEYYNTSISPGGNWLAISCGDRSNQTLEIARKDGKRWTLYFKDYLSAEKIDQYGTAGSLQPVHWTEDEAYLYFMSSSPFDGGGSACFYGPGIIDLYRINLNTGKVSPVLADTLDFTFSPGGRWLAYIHHKPFILDLKTGEKVTIEIGNAYAGTPKWSPDGSELAYATCQQTPDGSQIVKSTIKIYSLTTRTSKTILQLEKSFLTIETLEGDGPNLQRISDEDYPSGNWRYLFFEWTSEQFVTPTVTPTP